MNIEERLKRLEEKIFGDSIDIEKWKPKDTVKSKLLNIEIATNDYWEKGEDGEFGVADGVKKYFTFDEACAIEEKLGNGWRTPTRREIAIICEEFGQDSDGGLGAEMICGAPLYFVRSGYYYYGGSMGNLGSSGGYWSSTVSSTNFAYNLYFDSTLVYPQDLNNRGYGFSLRLVRDLEEQDD